MPSPGKTAGPLAGIRVIDLSRVLAGPFCGALLADLGADVVRVEHPTQLDETRAWAPGVDGVSSAYTAVNHSKRGMAIDLANADGREVFRRLAATADVLLENFRPGTMERLGVGRDELMQVNSRLVYCAVRAFPAGTADAERPGYEASMQALSGIMSLTGEHDGEAVRCGVSVVDLGTGMASTIAVLAALRERDRTGVGQYVEPALMRTATNFLNYQIAGFTMAGVMPLRYGSGHEKLVPYGSFRCSDGSVTIAAGNDRLWARLCKVLALRDGEGRLPHPALSDRIANRGAVNGMVGTAVAGRRRKEVIAALDEEGIPCAPVNTIAEYLDDATLLSARVLDNVKFKEGRQALLAGPLFAADFVPAERHAAPGLGEHTDELLRSLGYGDAEIRALRDRAAVC